MRGFCVRVKEKFEMNALVKKVVKRARINFILLVFVPTAYFFLLRGIFFLIQHKSFRYTVIVYLSFILILIVALIVNFFISKKEKVRPWWVKFTFTLLFGIAFTPVLTILAPSCAFLMGLIQFSPLWCALTSFCSTIALFSVGIYVVSKGNINIIRNTGKAIGIINHRSSGDYLLIPWLAWGLYWRVMIGANLWKELIFSWFFSKIGLQVVREKERADSRTGTMYKSEAFLDSNEKAKVYAFSEGTRTRDEYIPLLPFKNGAFLLAMKTGVPIIPIVVVGMDKWRKPGKQDTTAYVKKKFRIKDFIRKIPKFPRKVWDFVLRIFKEGINPSKVTVIYLDPMHPTKEDTVETFKLKVWCLMWDTYIEHAYKKI